MAGKVDLVMWTKNGAETLGPVLRRINAVIPKKVVNKRIIVDDHSVDNTREIGQSLGWQVLLNEGSGISDGANTALKNVESDYFISFEQDLLLAPDWWQKIPVHLSDPNVAIASGVRLPNKPLVMHKIEEYFLERNEKKARIEKSFMYEKSLDNTMYRTAVVRLLGGFPKLTIPAGVDTILVQRLYLNKFEWKVDYSVKSTHLRKNLRQEIRHYYWYGTCWNTLNVMVYKQNMNTKPMLRLFLSPLRGLQIALKKNAPEAVYVYPLLRFALLKGISDGLKNK